MSQYLPYAGIGSRQTPNTILALMGRIGFTLANLGFTLRSGGARGADSAFEAGVAESKHHRVKEIFLPWEGFSAYPRDHPLYRKRSTKEGGVEILGSEHFQKAREIARNHHPAWSYCSEGAKQLHTRNVAQVLGRNLDSPAKFIVCWTQGGKGEGGTGQALRIAKSYNIPIYDLGGNLKEVTKALSDYCEYLVMPEIAEPRE